MKINRKVLDIYENDVSVLIVRLKFMPKFERFLIYQSHSRLLFKKSKEIVNLEDVVASLRHDYIHKFKKSFLVIGTRFFSTSHFGEYNQEYFIKRTGFNSQRYPQKVILALSMMGFIRGVSCGYSNGHHGYMYDIDYWKYKGWGYDFFVDMDIEEISCSPCQSHFDPVNPVLGDKWLLEKQINTIKQMEVDEDFFSHVQFQKDSILGSGVSREKMSSVDVKKLCFINDVENLYHKTDRCLNATIDGESGRFYSIMTGLKSNVRHGNILSIGGVKFKEVDLSNSQPTLLGLMVKKKLDEAGIKFNSMWLRHALSGDFYEWLVDITHLIDHYSVDEIVKNLDDKVSRLGKSRNKKVVEQGREIEDLLTKVRTEKSLDSHKRLRPIIKHWIIKFLFGKKTVSAAGKEVKDMELMFLKNLCRYLQENEPYIYQEIIWYKKHPEPKRKNPDETASPLARNLQEEEVRFIKQCLRNLDNEVEYLYTVHDCIGCLETDVDIVTRVMTQTALDYYGVALNLKVE